jgi:hypothetical protein
VTKKKIDKTTFRRKLQATIKLQKIYRSFLLDSKKVTLRKTKMIVLNQVIFLSISLKMMKLNTNNTNQKNHIMIVTFLHSTMTLSRVLIHGQVTVPSVEWKKTNDFSCEMMTKTMIYIKTFKNNCSQRRKRKKRGL